MGLFPANPEIVRAEKRVHGIDVLRGLCIIAVVLHHINLRIHFRESGFGQWIGPSANRVLFWSGYYGVRVFFVISGFLITTWSLKRWGGLSQLNRRHFYWMRFARIVPCLVGLLVILVILDRAGVPRFTINTQHTSLGRALLAALTFHVNWLEARTGYLPAAWDILWSLSVEEVFYVFFPLLCTLVRKPAILIALLSCFLVAGPFARVSTQNALWVDYGYLSCMDGIALGCLAAMISAKIKLGDKANLVLRIVGTLLCLLITVFRGSAARIGFYKIGLDVTVLGIGTALLLIALQKTFETSGARPDSSPASGNNFAAARKALFRSTSFLRWFGRNSYEVYLTHMLVVWPMVLLFLYFRLSINWSPLWFLITTALAGICGYLVARFYSEPLNDWLRAKSMPAKAKTAAVTGD
ncbi:MAG TPA: acyltransferase [Verrucomicrobiae bacterium]|nr:acyltransferase [Verrucomicrobiae bacterium]